MEKSKNRISKQREIILEELRKVNTHPTADEIYKIVQKRVPKISLGTVYRNLEVLSENKEILKLDLGTNKKRYDGDIKKHYHIRCVKCDRVDDINIDLIKFNHDFSLLTDYEIIEYRLDFLGICPECKKDQKRI